MPTLQDLLQKADSYKQKISSARPLAKEELKSLDGSPEKYQLQRPKRIDLTQHLKNKIKTVTYVKRKEVFSCH